MDGITAVTAIVTGAIAATCDWRTGRVPNLLTLPVITLGILYTFYHQGMEAGIMRCILLFLVSLLGMAALMGMGDLKLIMAFLAVGGMEFMIYTVAIASILLLLIEFAIHKRDTLTDMRAGIWSLMTLNFDQTLGTGRKVKFAPYLLLGAIGGVVICVLF